MAMNIQYEEIPKIWKEKFELGQLKNVDITNFWNSHIPQIFSFEVNFLY